MRTTVLEYGKLHRSVVGPGPWERLRRFDELHSRRSESPTAFDWRYPDYAVARNMVGVLRVPGLTVEILPKVCDSDAHLARTNLLHMLHAAGAFPVMLRDTAEVALERISLLDALVCAFARRLLDELTRGPDRGYVTREDNLRYVRGRILVPEDACRNSVLRHRVYVAYDEFVEDTTINRVLKAAARKLLRLEAGGARPLLTRVIEELDAVDDTALRLAEIHRVTFHRNNVRFETLFDFARFVLLDSSPAPRGGPEDSFALLFGMDRLFEAYFARYVLHHAGDLGLDPSHVRVQARGAKKWLLCRKPDDHLMYRLEPDLVIDRHGRFPGAVFDTKWKRLTPGPSGGPEQADVYQLAVYAAQFDLLDNVLVYPKTAGLQSRAFRIVDSEARVRFALLPLDHDLRRKRETLEYFRLLVWGEAAALAGTH